MTILFDETQKFHPLRECIGKIIEGTGSSPSNISLTFNDGTVLIFDLLGSGDLMVSFANRNPHL